jgi:hypothetical protein
MLRHTFINVTIYFNVRYNMYEFLQELIKWEVVPIYICSFISLTT